MADIQCRFDNTAFGGNHAYTVPVVDMIDYPYEGEQVVGKDAMEAQSGKLWEYKWYDKEVLNLHFGDVSAACFATMGSIVKDGCSFVFWKDYVGASGVYGTYVFGAEDLTWSEDVPGYTFDFPVRELE